MELDNGPDSIKTMNEGFDKRHTNIWDQIKNLIEFE